jgi:DNA-binding Lrp family transcriptional regulator
MKSLDRTDYKILDILQENARITNQELASKVALAPSSCLQRVRRLEEDDVISGFHARVDLHTVCRFVTCIANVKLKNHSYKELIAFQEAAQAMPEIIEYHTVSGECDAILKIICRDMPAYLELNERLLRSSEYAATINTHVVLNENKMFTSVDLETLR